MLFTRLLYMPCIMRVILWYTSRTRFTFHIAIFLYVVYICENYRRFWNLLFRNLHLFIFIFFSSKCTSLPFSLDFYQKFTTFTRIAYFSQTCTFIRNMQFSQSLIFWIFYNK